MSSKKNCLSTTTVVPENPNSGGGCIVIQDYIGDPLDRIYEPSEDSDWEVAFRDSIRPSPISLPPSHPIPLEPADPTPSFWIYDKEQRENTDMQKPQSLEPFEMNNPQENTPIQLHGNAHVMELSLPVVPIPLSSFAPLWSQNYISTIHNNIQQPSTIVVNSIPLHLAEGIKDPTTTTKDPKKDEPSSPLSVIQGRTKSPWNSGDTPSFLQPPIDNASISSSQPALRQPEDFIDECHILQWAIDDSDLTSNNVDFNLTAPHTVTSGEFNQTRATTTNFITEIKNEPEIIPPLNSQRASVLQLTSNLQPASIPGPSFIASPTIKSELDDSDWEPQSIPKTRKRGRPSKPLGSGTITPVVDLTGSMTDDEVSAQKYRRMRDLNNEASRRCRESRKGKQSAAEIELEMLQTRNIHLKKKLIEMEQNMRILKRRILTDVKNSSSGRYQGVEAYLNMTSGINQSGNHGSLDAYLNGPSGGDLDSMWSQLTS